MKKAVTIILILVLIGFIGYKVKVKLEQQQLVLREAAAQQGQPRNGLSTPVVKVLQVTPEPIKETLRLVGNIQAETEISVQPKISGRLISLLVDEGVSVTRGQLIAELDDENIELQLQQSEANIASLKAKLQQDELSVARYKAEKERYQELLNKRYISQQNYDNIENSYLTAQAAWQGTKSQLAAAEKNYEMIKLQLSQTKIYAPVTGYVLQKLVTPGMNLTSGSTIVVVAALKPVKLVFNIDQSDARKFRKGLPVSFSTDALPEKVFNGTISQLSPTYDPRTRTLGMSVVLPNQSEELVPGMFGTAEIMIGGKDFALVVPQEALVNQGNQAGVFVVDQEQKARFRPTQTGLLAEGRVEIITGLQTNDQVVVIGQNRLKDGQYVEVIGASGTPRKAGSGQ